MPFDSTARSQKAQKQLRDASGHFYSAKPKAKISGQANLLSQLIETGDKPPEDSMMGIYFRDPFKKLMGILEDIKNKQSTTVALKFTIPLVALPVAILIAFQFGRYQSGCGDNFSSQVGTLQYITVTRKFEPNSWFLKALSYLPFSANIYSREATVKQAVLVKANQDGVIINNEANANLAAFDQGKVIIFGDYNSCAQTLTLDSAQNISNY